MLNERLDGGSAGGSVGHESPSQFSREYRRLFGAPPQRDVTRMLLAPVAGASNPFRTAARSGEPAPNAHSINYLRIKPFCCFELPQANSLILRR
jgi:AraC-like DNA-binding protein